MEKANLLKELICRPNCARTILREGNYSGQKQQRPANPGGKNDEQS
jgi:hypothetical protein